MTNREAFNQYIRKIAEKQIQFVESMDDAALVNYTINHPDFRIHIMPGDKLAYFKCMLAGIPVGNKEQVIAWLSEEAKEDIPWENLL